jgi:hypothetical protein
MRLVEQYAFKIITFCTQKSRDSSVGIATRLHTGWTIGVVGFDPPAGADHSPPSSAEVKNAWCYTSTHGTSSWRVA